MFNNFNRARKIKSSLPSFGHELKFHVFSLSRLGKLIYNEFLGYIHYNKLYFSSLLMVYIIPCVLHSKMCRYFWNKNIRLFLLILIRGLNKIGYRSSYKVNVSKGSITNNVKVSNNIIKNQNSIIRTDVKVKLFECASGVASYCLKTCIILVKNDLLTPLVKLGGVS